MRRLKASIQIENIWYLKKQRENDIRIMEKNMSLKGITNSQMEVINMCQVYLRIIMISDLANISGNAIPPGRMLGQWRKESKLEWPDITKPPPKALKIFRRIMVKAFGTLSRV